jgi:transcriptional regulator GlxA family with amidase domain
MALCNGSKKNRAMSVLPDIRIQRVIAYVANNLDRRITLAEAAGVACLEPFYFSKRFRKGIGESFVTWNARIRVEAARRLLLESNRSITAIAAAVGYGDVTTFERAFRRFEPVAPREYRRIGQFRSARNKTESAESRTGNAEIERPGS